MLRFQQDQTYTQHQLTRIAQENGISKPLAAALAYRRLFEKADIDAFLHPSVSQFHDPYLLQDMNAAVCRIRLALEKRERICVYGDYDADGVCAVAMLVTCLKKHGGVAEPYIPSRQQGGYGLHTQAVRALRERGVQLIITVDNGVSAKEEIAFCNELGMDVIVTDHHQCPKELPSCVAVINPHREHNKYPYENLCGAGVAFKLIMALCGDEALDYLTICALATVADVVELRGENRAIVALGLPQVAEHIGLQALLEVSGSAGQPVTSEILAFRLAPRLNAAGRMGDAMLALRLLMAQDTAEARRIALELNEANTQRQRQEQAILCGARDMLKPRETARMRAILLYAPQWNSGVLGIVAARLREEYYRPVLLFHQEGDTLTGSCRSIPGVHLYDCLLPFEDMFIRFGGHALAAGITMKLTEFPAFCEAFEAYLAVNIPHTAFIPTMTYEQEVKLDLLSINEIETLAALAPHGQGNPPPIYHAGDLSLTGIEQMGKERTHLRATAVQGKARLGVVAFGQGHNAEEWKRQGKYEILYTPMINAWQGMRRIQLQACAIRQETFFDKPDTLALYHKNFYNAFFNNFLYNGVQDVSAAEANADIAAQEGIEADIAGTLLLCFTPAGAERLAGMLRARNLHNHVQVYVGRLPANAAAYHTVLLAPELRALDTAKYSSLVVYDAWPYCRIPGQGKAMPQAPLDTGMLQYLQLDRTAMARIYQSFGLILRDAPKGWQAAVKACTAASYESALLSLLVFIELGFIAWMPEHGTVRLIEGCQTRDLMQSKLYAAVNSETYKKLIINGKEA